MGSKKEAKIRKFMSDFLNIEDSEIIDQLVDNAFIKKTTHKDSVINAGEVSDTLYFIVSGVYRAYYKTSTGDDVTVVVHGANEVILSTADMSNPTPNICSYQTIAPGELIGVPFSLIVSILEKCPEFYIIYSKLLAISISKQIVLSQIRHEDALTRVKWIHEKHPSLVAKIQKQFVANILGMTQSTYSKILKKI